MKFTSPAQIRALADFRSESLLTTSFFLDTDKSRQTKKEIAVSFKNLFSDGRTRLEAMDLSKAKKESLLRDLEKISRFGAQRLAAWSAGALGLLDSLKSDVPSRVREGGWKGYESKRIERHIDAHLHDHFKKASLKTFDLFKKNQFDWLFISCKEEYRSDFEPLLHPYLKERLKGWLKTDSNHSGDKILKQSLEMERSLKAEEETTLAQSLVSELEKGGRAVSGIKEGLSKLNTWA